MAYLEVGRSLLQEEHPDAGARDGAGRHLHAGEPGLADRHTPGGFYDRVDDGSVELRRCRGSVGFCADGLVVLDDDDNYAADPAVFN